MAELTGIEWTDHTFNPWWGCEKVSPGCAHCYAETLANRHANGVQLWGEGHGFRFFGDKHWAEPLRWNRRAEADGVRRRVFCASMADVFEDRPELDESRWRLFRLILDTPDLDWLLLTKRPEFASDWLGEWRQESGVKYRIASGDPWNNPWGNEPGGLQGCLDARPDPPNLWVGVSIENARHTWRADVLREIPAAVRFISAEPLLGSLFDVAGRVRRSGQFGASGFSTSDEAENQRNPLDLTGIDWVIVGGESGPGARPMRLEWAREICDAAYAQCWGCTILDGAGGTYVFDGAVGHAEDEPCTRTTAVFVKQLGAKPTGWTYIPDPIPGPVALRLGDVPLKLRDRRGGDWDEWPADLRIREFPRTQEPS